jgi:TonB family protein
VPVSSVPEATSFSASITRTSLPADVPDRPEVLAALVPGETSKTFESDVSGSGCLITPESLRNFGQPVTARITVDNTGNVIGVDRPLLTPSGNPSYDELATCAIKTWKFSPAYNKKDGEKSYVFSNLDVEITITSAVK